MDKIYVVFWTQGGNTGAMAKAVGDGITAAGKEPVFVSPSEANVSEISEAKAFALGCPAMGAEVLEETEMEPFVEELESKVSGKSIALFGSYGWGDGQWMRDWEDRMKKAGAEIVNGAGVICQEAPDDEAVAECEALGKAVASV